MNNSKTFIVLSILPKIESILTKTEEEEKEE
jgi:hypothetical protein